MLPQMGQSVLWSRIAEGQQISYAEIVPILTKFASSHSNIVNTALLVFEIALLTVGRMAQL